LPEPADDDDEVAAAALAKAEVAFSGGHMATARIAATQAVAASGRSPAPLQVRSHIIMGKVELASERFPEAERAFDRALAIDPKNAVAHKGKERAREAAAKARAP
jgi:cytochrome c-type biogenesis protein CcmH/NrfG